MELRHDLNTYLYLQKGFQDFCFIYARSGYGKTLAIESLIEEYHNRGYVVIILSDVKDEFEMMFSMFKPRKRYHIEHLKKIGKPIQTKPVKIYHPFTFNIPTNKQLPEIKFYGFPIKRLKRSEWSMLSESAFESETIRLLLNASSNLKSNEGLYSFLHNIEDSVVGKKDKGRLKADPKHFYLRITSATAKGLQEVASYLLPFKKNYFLVPENSELNLDWKEILKDNKNYHCFSTYWIEDEKLKEFCILALFNSILRNKEYAKRPILIVIPEIRFLTPLRPEGYKKFLAFGIKTNLSIMRNMGKGFSGVFDSQVWSDVDEAVRNSATFTLYGELGGGADLEKVGKANRYKREIVDQLKNMPYRNSYFIHGKESEGTFTCYFPGHCHAEPEYNFFEMYAQECRDKLVNYSKLYEKMKKELKTEEDLFKEKVKKRDKEEKEKEERVKAERESKTKDNKDLKEKSQKIGELRRQMTEDKKKRCWKLYEENPDWSYSDLAKEVGVSKTMIMRYVKELKSRQEAEQNTEYDDGYEGDEKELNDEQVPELGKEFQLPEE